MIDLKELEELLSTCSERSELFELVKRIMKERGRWKAKPRGIPGFNLKKSVY